MSESSDHFLIRAYLAGDGGAFDTLYRRYAARVHATALRLTGNWDDAEDALQDVFISLAKSAGKLRADGSVAAWIYTATVNRATDLLRARRRTVPLDENEAGGARLIAVTSLRRGEESAESAEREGLLQRVERLIPRLPERQAAAFVLRFHQGLSHREIAAILGCGEGASKSHVSLATARLREIIEAEDGQAARAEREGRQSAGRRGGS